MLCGSLNKNNKLDLNSNYFIGDTKIDLNKMKIINNEKEKKINNSEKKVLIEMIANPGTTFSREH